MFQHRLAIKHTLSALAVAGLTAVGSCRPCQAQQLTAAQRAAFTQKLDNIIPNSVDALRTVQDLEALSPEDMFRVLSDNWGSLANSDAKLYLLSTLLQND